MISELNRLQKKRADGLLTENESDMLCLIEDMKTRKCRCTCDGC